MIFYVYTDGACSGNPGPGGYAAVILNSETNTPPVVLRGYSKHTTNNIMELMGIIHALTYIPQGSNINIYTDSEYVQKGITEYLHKWRKNNFKDIKNVRLWKEIYSLLQLSNVKISWVKGHNGDMYNEMADAEAVKTIELGKANKIPDIFDTLFTNLKG